MSLAGSDPFVDPAHLAEDGVHVEASTLSVGRCASLTLATDSLIVLGVHTLALPVHMRYCPADIFRRRLPWSCWKGRQ